MPVRQPFAEGPAASKVLATRCDCDYTPRDIPSFYIPQPTTYRHGLRCGPCAPRPSANWLHRFEDGDLHGFINSGTQPFIYMSVTSPPLNFRAAYDSGWSSTMDNKP